MSAKDKKVSEIVLEERKIKALEKIAASLDSLAFFFEGIDKDGGDDRMQYYLGEWQKSLNTGSGKKSGKKSGSGDSDSDSDSDSGSGSG